MIAFAVALAYVATLGFAAFLLWRRDRYREDVRDRLVSVTTQLAALEHQRERWNGAADFVEAQQVSKGLRGIGR